MVYIFSSRRPLTSRIRRSQGAWNTSHRARSSAKSLLWTVRLTLQKASRLFQSPLAYGKYMVIRLSMRPTFGWAAAQVTACLIFADVDVNAGRPDHGSRPLASQGLSRDPCWLIDQRD